MSKTFRKDLTGKQFHYLTVDSFRPDSRDKSYWLCECHCGNSCVVQGHKLTSGHTKSCGCYHIERIKGANTVHGYFGTPTYNSWAAMIRRCTDPNNNRYKYYGGRGISVCREWLDSFQSFLEDMGERPSDRTLDRVDPDGDYKPSNCRWATAVEQRNNRSIMDRGED